MSISSPQFPSLKENIPFQFTKTEQNYLHKCLQKCPHKELSILDTIFYGTYTELTSLSEKDITFVPNEKYSPVEQKISNLFFASLFKLYVHGNDCEQASDELTDLMSKQKVSLDAKSLVSVVEKVSNEKGLQPVSTVALFPKGFKGPSIYTIYPLFRKMIAAQTQFPYIKVDGPMDKVNQEVIAAKNFVQWDKLNQKLNTNNRQELLYINVIRKLWRDKTAQYIEKMFIPDIRDRILSSYAWDEKGQHFETIDYIDDFNWALLQLNQKHFPDSLGKEKIDEIYDILTSFFTSKTTDRSFAEQLTSPLPSGKYPITMLYDTMHYLDSTFAEKKKNHIQKLGKLYLEKKSSTTKGELKKILDKENVTFLGSFFSSYTEIYRYITTFLTCLHLVNIDKFDFMKDLNARFTKEVKEKTNNLLRFHKGRSYAHCLKLVSKSTSQKKSSKTIGHIVNRTLKKTSSKRNLYLDKLKNLSTQDAQDEKLETETRYVERRFEQTNEEHKNNPLKFSGIITSGQVQFYPKDNKIKIVHSE